MKNSYSRVLSAVMYFIAFVSLLCLIGSDFIMLELGRIDKLVATVMFFLFSAIGTRLWCIGKDYRRCRICIYSTAAFMFVAYLVIVVDFTLIDDTFGRSLSSIFTCGRERLLYHIENDVNFTPFKTVMLFINGYKKHLVTDYAFVENLLGNFCVFMPFAFFVPMLFKRVNNSLKLLLAVSSVVIIIEALQFVFMTGCADIDDLILNVGGSLLAYGIFRIPSVDRYLNLVSYGVWRCRE